MAHGVIVFRHRRGLCKRQDGTSVPWVLSRGRPGYKLKGTVTGRADKKNSSGGAGPENIGCTDFWQCQPTVKLRT